MSGFTPTGFVAPTLEEIRAEIVAELLARIDAALDLSSDQPLGQVVAVMAQREAILWELVQTLADATNPSATEGFLLDNLASMTGTVREPATKTIVYLDCVVTDGFTKSAGQMMANVAGHADRNFVNAFDVGPLPAGTHSIEFQSTTYGPNVANAGTLTVISPAVVGWTSCTNPLDGDTGSNRETDPELMVRRETELAAPGSGTVDSIRSDTLQIAGVEQCFVFENQTMATDADGLPPKSFEVVVYDGLTPTAVDADIAQLIWDSKPSGIQPYGSILEFAVDSQGVTRAAPFSRATVRQVWFEFDAVVDTAHFPSDGATQIKDAVAAYAKTNLNLGIDVVSLKMKSAALLVPGVLDITALRLGFTVSPVGTTNLVLSGREIASVDTSRITVATTPGAP